MWELVMFYLNQIPTNEVVGECLGDLKVWYTARSLLVTPALFLLAWGTYKTPWKWDDNVLTVLYDKLGVSFIINKIRKSKKKEPKDESEESL